MLDASYEMITRLIPLRDRVASSVSFELNNWIVAICHEPQKHVRSTFTSKSKVDYMGKLPSYIVVACNESQRLLH